MYTLLFSHVHTKYSHSLRNNQKNASLSSVPKYAHSKNCNMLCFSLTLFSSRNLCSLQQNALHSNAQPHQQSSPPRENTHYLQETPLALLPLLSPTPSLTHPTPPLLPSPTTTPSQIPPLLTIPTTKPQGLLSASPLLPPPPEEIHHPPRPARTPIMALLIRVTKFALVGADIAG